MFTGTVVADETFVVVKAYRPLGHEFLSHEWVSHGRHEYVRGDVATNQAEGTSLG